jgi:hypothetical protein
MLVEDDEVGKLEWSLERLWRMRDERLRALIALSTVTWWSRPAVAVAPRP